MFGLIDEACVCLIKLVFALYFVTFSGLKMIFLEWFNFWSCGLLLKCQAKTTGHSSELPFCFLKSSLLPIEFVISCHSRKTLISLMIQKILCYFVTLKEMQCWSLIFEKITPTFCIMIPI